MGIKDRIGALRKRWQAADKLARTSGADEYERDARDIYGLMREAWEQATTEVLLNDVVRACLPEDRE
jgi:ABC-type transporter lipoprotein component MlaA